LTWRVKPFHEDDDAMWVRCITALIATGILAGGFAARVEASPAVPCAGDGASTAQAVTAADAVLRSKWRDVQPNWYSAFATRPPKRNPFDKSAEPETTEIIKGIVWAQGIYCIATMSPDGNEMLVRYFANAVAFHEGQGWSRVFGDGLIQVYVAKRSGETWQVKPLAEAPTILLPDVAQTVPNVDAIPPRDAQRGIPCRTGTVWSGRRCELPRAAQR
jgi:hypothetical protein